MTFFIGNEKLAQYGEQDCRAAFSGGQKRAGRHTHTSGKAVSREVKRLLQRLEKLYGGFKAGGVRSKTAEWLCDNMYMVRRESASVAEDFKRAGRLGADSEGCAAVLIAARGLVRAGSGFVDGERTALYLSGFMECRRLPERELTLFAASLRLELLRYLYENISSSGDNNADDASGSAQSSEAEQIAENVFKTLFRLAATDLYKVLESVNPTEKILRLDPSGHYCKMDVQSRAIYRRELAKLASGRGIEESDAAKTALELASAGEGYKRHVGYYIFVEPLGAKRKRKPYALYIGLNAALTLSASFLLAMLYGGTAAFALALFPISEAVKYLLDRLIMRLRPPARLPMLELGAEDLASSEYRTLCVTAALITSPQSAVKAFGCLEEYRLANRKAEGVYYGLLADLPETKSETAPGDAEALMAAKAEAERLNAKYGGGFVFLLRKRTYSERDRVYRGWERKRGAVMELIRLLKQGKSGVEPLCGDHDAVRDIKYIIILDSDTRLNAGCAAELIGTIAHPLSKPVIDAEARSVLHGNGIIAPKIGVDLYAANRSDFTRIFAGQGGLDPYGSAGSDVYQDMFGEGSFAGKGIMSVEAAYACLDRRFPLDTLLSHDLIEGEYLRCAYAGSIELTDGFPSSLLSYYERQHRWIRGDWQTLRWLFPRIKDEAGKADKNPLTPLGKWKIIDNLRRSLVPVMTFLAIFLYCVLGGRELAASAAAAALSLAVKVIVNSMKKPDIVNKTYRTSVFTAAASDFMQFIILSIILPYAAYISASAIMTSLYRQLISKRNLLKWVTAAESEGKRRRTVAHYYKKMLACPAAAAAGLLLAPSAPAAALFILWLAAPALGWALSRERGTQTKISTENRAFLLRCAKDIWRYFENYLTAERNWLPPDNMQEEPVEIVAERTSPTNIGLALLAALTAADLGLCEKKRALRLMDSMLQAVEELPKYKGHLYNWYDIKTMAPLKPEYISTVDSGNLIACLLAASAGLNELGEARLAERAKRLADAMDMGFLYDGERRLMHIGYDAQSGSSPDCWYDLLESEARIASYIAVARGEADRRHWRRLGRILAQTGGVCGLASWTGTMFEYFMPCLLLPVFRHSLLHESLIFCFYAQRKGGDKKSGVWGISESAFYSYDACMNYSYKAHGVQSAALKRGMDRDKVISPYSTFLALGMGVPACVRNLKRLRRLGMEGKYGFYEAVDFTPSRTGSLDYQRVRCFMTHHMAMSIAAINNALNGDIMVRRFMSHPEMRAYAELLQEKGPVGQLIRTDSAYKAEERPERIRNEGWNMAGRDYSLERPLCFPLSNGTYSVLLTELGSSRSKCGGRLIAAFEPRRFTEKHGLLFFALSGGELIPLQPAPEFAGGAEYGFEFLGNCHKQYCKAGTLDFCITTFAALGECGEKRILYVKNNGGEEAELAVACYFEPALAPEAAYAAHPAFIRLSMETKRKNGCVIVSRRAGGMNKPYSLALACGTAFQYDTDKAAALGRGGLRTLPEALDRPAGSTAGPVAEPCVLIRIPLNLRPGEKKELELALAAGEGEEEAAAAAGRILKQSENDNKHFFNSAALYSMTASEIESAVRLLTGLVYETSERKERYEKYREGGAGKSSLWRFGISGDCPLVAAEAADIGKDEKPAKTAALLKCYAFLTRLGFELDLALIIDESGQYGRPEYSAALEQVQKLNLEGRLNRKAGIHIISGFEAELNAVRAMADLYLAGGLGGAGSDACAAPSGSGKPGARATVGFFVGKGEAGDRLFSFKAGGVFSFEGAGKYGRWVWSNMLTNGSMGFIAADSGTGSLWLGNSRENRLDRWTNDPLALVGSERLEYLTGGRRVSLFGGSVEFGFGWARWRNKIGDSESDLLAFISAKADARYFILRLQGFKPGDKISFFMQAVLGSEEEGQKTTLIKTEPGGRPEVCAENGFKVSLWSSARAARLYADELEFMTGGAARGGKPAIAAEYEAGRELVLVLSAEDAPAAATLEEAERELEEARRHWEEKTGFIKIRTPCPELDAYINGWAAYQIIACRLMGRNSMYQSGGAFGFRDQLQDVCALIDSQPELARKHIIRAAEHQYAEGDVQHWWHEPFRGVRTRCSDDLLWLPYAAAQYVVKTGDTTLLDEKAAFLSSPVLADDERDRYEIPQITGMADIREHCLRAIGLVLKRGFGQHGQLLIGGGDWNDGFDNMGEGAESVWLTWFAALAMREFAEALSLGSDRAPADQEKARELKEAALHLAAKAEAAYDGGHYLRGYYGSGDPVGADGNQACAIDSIAQSFSVLSGLGDGSRGRAAVRKAAERLCSGGIARLFDPPFGSGARPGYICSYLEGVRENGGQYTHAAVWLAMACLRSGEIEAGWRILRDLLPQNKNTERYKAEPFVLAADVYANPYLYGRGGWSWYTGAAGWYLRAVVEELLGLKLKNGKLTVEPKLPSSWDGFEAEYAVLGKKHKISVSGGGARVKLEND